MFEIDGNRILLTQGDSGLLTIKVQSSHTFSEADKAVFTVRAIGGAVKAQMLLQPDADGTVQIPLTSNLSDEWRAGRYEWDIRYVLDAVFEGGVLVDGREVITPMRPGALEIVRAVGSI